MSMTSVNKRSVPRLGFRPDEAAESVGIGRRSIEAEIRAGRIVAHKYGSAVIIEEAELRRWLGSLPVAAAIETSAAAE
jgi:excisionase family DNA binding protein